MASPRMPVGTGSAWDTKVSGALARVCLGPQLSWASLPPPPPSQHTEALGCVPESHRLLLGFLLPLPLPLSCDHYCNKTF